MLQFDNSCVISKVTKSDFHYTIMFLAGKCVRTCCDRGCEPLFWFSDPPQDQFDLLLMSFSFAVSQNELHRESLSGSSAWFIIRTCDRGVSLDPSPGSWVILECPPGGATTTENRASRTQKCGRVKCFHVTETQIDKRQARRPAGLVLWLQFNWPVYTHKPQTWHLLPNCTLTPQSMNQKKKPWTKDTTDNIMRTVRSIINHQNQLWHHLNSVNDL